MCDEVPYGFKSMDIRERVAWPFNQNGIYFTTYFSIYYSPVHIRCARRGVNDRTRSGGILFDFIYIFFSRAACIPSSGEITAVLAAAGREGARICTVYDCGVAQLARSSYT